MCGLFYQQSLHIWAQLAYAHWSMVLFCTEQKSDFKVRFAEQLTTSRAPRAVEEQFSFSGLAVEERKERKKYGHSYRSHNG